ncbi:tripartite tricarboxylate transporter TctB family protein [Granulosicoccus sp. 3-233]|uniref:tripartite tricarboxylate transporter TctB family protein n=1 Tax=Granulosicoccus sp. 3-233 TaxID=3417969 RepID=UPI003D345C5B
MSRDVGKEATGRLGSLIVSAFFVIAGVVTLYDTLSYSDMDSKVFPRAAAIVLIVCAMLSIVGNLLRPVSEPGFGQGAWWRRILLVLSMLAACLAMPLVGFLPAGFIAFGGSLFASMHERWSARAAIVFLLSSLMIMVGFYALFRFVLHVPLP